MKNPITKKGTELPLLDLRGKPYLTVPYRVLWAREDMPELGFETEIIDHNDNKSIVRATIRNEAGRILAQATKQEDIQGFRDHLEKAETGAIGRALALIGFGTQFALELEEGDRIVDAPVSKTPNRPNPANKPSDPTRDKLAAGIQKLVKELNLTSVQVKDMLHKSFGKDSSKLSADEMKQFLFALEDMANGK